jgi:hypothetical protein
MRLLASSVLFLSTAVSSSAMEFTQRGNAAYLIGGIKLGDSSAFEQFMARPEASSIRVFHLNSGGGSIANAMAIARKIRSLGGKTVVDGRQVCSSACGLIFAGGVTRHYINTGGLTDRLGGQRAGLGFHEGNNANADGRGVQYSGGASQAMIANYYALGAGGAAQFVTKAGHRQMYFISGATALSSGLATSLSPP